MYGNYNSYGCCANGHWISYLKPECVKVNLLESFVQKGSRFYFASDYVYIFKTVTARHKKTSQVSIVFHDEFVNVDQFYSIRCKKRNHKYCVSIKPSLLTSGLLQSWLAGDCFFRVVSHQLEGEP